MNFVNFEFRRHPARRELRALLRDDVVGTVEHLQWNAFHGVWLDPSRPFGWSFDRELGGGWIRLSGSHTIDYIRWSLGEIVDATGAIRTTITERADARGTNAAVHAPRTATRRCCRPSAARRSRSTRRRPTRWSGRTASP